MKLKSSSEILFFLLRLRSLSARGASRPSKASPCISLDKGGPSSSSEMAKINQTCQFQFLKAAVREPDLPKQNSVTKLQNICCTDH